MIRPWQYSFALTALVAVTIPFECAAQTAQDLLSGPETTLFVERESHPEMENPGLSCISPPAGGFARMTWQESERERLGVMTSRLDGSKGDINSQGFSQSCFSNGKALGTSPTLLSDREAREDAQRGMLITGVMFTLMVSTGELEDPSAPGLDLLTVGFGVGFLYYAGKYLSAR